MTIYCSGPEYRTDNNAFRANAIGESLDQMTSKRLATSEAKEQLAGFLNSKVSSLTDAYSGQIDLGQSGTDQVAEKRSEFERVFKNLFEVQVSQTLDGVRVICEEQTLTQNNMYKTYIAIEYPKDEFLRSFSSSIEKDDRIRAEHNYEKFKAAFEEAFKN